MGELTMASTRRNMRRLVLLVTLCVANGMAVSNTPLLPDLGNLSEQDMEDLVYSLLKSGNDDQNMAARSWDYIDNLNRRSPMQMDHSNPTTRLFNYNPYGKRSANIYSGFRSKFGNSKFIDDLYKRNFLENMFKRANEEKRSANIYSGFWSKFGNGQFIDNLYKRSANIFSGMRSRFGNGQFIDDLYRRSDNYEYSPMTDPITAQSYWSKLMKYYQPSTSKFYKRVTKPASSESANAKSKSADDETSQVEKKSANASPASL